MDTQKQVNGRKKGVSILIAAGTLVMLLQTNTFAQGYGFSRKKPLNVNANIDDGEDRFPQMATDGSGIWIAVWESDDTLNNTIGNDFDILFSRSTDGGLTWEFPEKLNSNAQSDIGNDRSPSIATDRRGDWIVVWESNDNLNDSIGEDKDILFSKSSNNGEKWSIPRFLNNKADSDMFDDIHPRICHGNNVWMTTWQSLEYTTDRHNVTDYDVEVSFFQIEGNVWSDPVALNDRWGSNTVHEENPDIATNGFGEWVVTATFFVPMVSAIFISPAYSMNDGVVWTYDNIRHLSVSMPRGIFPRLENDGGSLWVLVFNGFGIVNSPYGKDGDIFLSKSWDRGQNWTDGVPINFNSTMDSASDINPDIATDRKGNWVAVWSSSGSHNGASGGDYDIFLVISNDNCDNWTDSIILNSSHETDIMDDFNPNVVTDGMGRWVVSWETRMTSGSQSIDDGDLYFSISDSVHLAGQNGVEYDWSLFGNGF